MHRSVLFTLILALNFSVHNAQSIQAIKKARQAYTNKNWNDASNAYLKLVKENPYKGVYHYKLANSYFKNENYIKATKYFKESALLGYNYGLSLKKLAYCYAELKDHKNTVLWINKGLKTPKSLTFQELLSSPHFVNFRETKDFKELYPIKEEREQKWISDILFLKDRFESKHYKIFDRINQTEWENDFNNLLTSIKQKEDAEILVDLMKITTKIGDGHTFIRPPFTGGFKLHLFPFKLYAFEEGMYVVQTTKEYKTIIGRKLTHIDGVPIQEVIKKVSKTISVDNKIGLLERLDFNLMLSEILKALKITKNSKEATFTFENSGKKTIELNVKAVALNPASFTEVLQSERQPFYQLHQNDFFWSKYLKDIDAMYLKLNINLSTPQQDIRDFYQTVFNKISKNDIKYLIIDLRDCPGGNSFNNAALIKSILANNTLDKTQGIFTIIGRRTFSAAMNLSMDLENWTNTMFIGEPTGSSPNFIGETNFVTLPNTGLQVSISDAYWQKSVSWDKREWIAPDIYIKKTYKDFISGEDPSIERIKTIIKNKQR